MSSVLKSLAFCACFGLFSIAALGQGTTCSTDADSAKGSPIACVTGEGVQVKAAATTTAEPQSSDVLPLAPEQRPASRPVVIYQNGKLTIMANNATLGDILDIVGEKTGAVIDVPEAATERVVSQLGPGLPRDVIASLLNGSHFNYVVVGTETDENAVSRVVLTAKTDHADTANGRPGVMTAGLNRAMTQPRNALQQALAQANQVMLQEQTAQPVQTPDFQQPPVASASETPAPVNQASTGGESFAAPGGPTGTETAAIDQPSANDGTQKSNAERTPQQVLQDLYETRRQQMMQAQPKPQQPAQ
jgi:fructose-specific component phosphotransferase system IIB-like protein